VGASVSATTTIADAGALWLPESSVTTSWTV
jgi:hypothetical protein